MPETSKNGSFTGKVAFVTGAANGIGRAAALAFAREGASVVVADVSEQGNQETARLIEEHGGRALAVRCDVTRAEDVKAALDKTVEAFGRLDFAFNNAGIEQKKPAPTAELDEEEWDRILNIDLRGVFLCMKHEIPLILKQGGGAIVNTSSGAGVIGIKGSPAYTAAKHGVIGLTRVGGPRLRRAEHPHQRRLPRVHRHPDDGSLHRGHGRGPREGDRGGAGRTDGQARGDRRGRRSGCARTRPPSSSVTPWSSTAAKPSAWPDRLRAGLSVTVRAVARSAVESRGHLGREAMVLTVHRDHGYALGRFSQETGTSPAFVQQCTASRSQGPGPALVRRIPHRGQRDHRHVRRRSPRPARLRAHTLASFTWWRTRRAAVVRRSPVHP